ncbi:MAG: mechanosensitive ion channel family protein [Phycisphaerales bacterium]|nr:mechanosensitive ion channel family protein [Phycisphaerales bacterium]
MQHSDGFVRWWVPGIVVGLCALAPPRAAEAATPIQPTTTQGAATAPAETRPAETRPADTQPTTPPARPALRNPLRTPYQAMQHFLSIVRDTERGEERFQEATGFLDLGALDADVRAVRGPELVRLLDEILQRLEADAAFDPEDQVQLPDVPALEVSVLQSFGRLPIVMILERMPRVVRDDAGEEQTLQEWRLARTSVALIPEWHAQLDLLIERVHAPRLALSVPPAEGAALSSPYALVTYFLDTWRAAQESGRLYESAFACLDFAGAVRTNIARERRLDAPDLIEAELERLGPDFVRKFITDNGIRYVDGLAQLISAARNRGVIDLEKLARSLPPEHKGFYAIGASPVQILLVRGPDGLWRFGATTVRDVPRMLELTQVVSPPPTPTPPPQPAAPPPTTAAPGVAPPAAVAAAPAAPASPRRTTRASKQFRSAQATLGTFRQAMERGDLDTAVQCLDLSGLSDTERELAGTLAGKLWLTLTRSERVPLSTVPDDPDGEAYELLARPEGRIEIDKQFAAGRAEEWLFTARTVRDIEELYDALEARPIHRDWKGAQVSFLKLPSLYLRELINTRINDRIVEREDPATGAVVEVEQPGVWPRWLGTSWLRLRVWQWIGIAPVLGLGWLVRRVAVLVLPGLGQLVLRSASHEDTAQAIRRAFKPVATLLMLLAWWGGLQFLDLGAPLMSWLWFFLKVLLAVAGVLAAYRLIDVAASYTRSRSALRSSRVDDVLIPLLNKTAKIVVAVGGLVFIGTTLGLAVTPLLAGLGVGGLAFGLAAQDTLKNFFGSVNVVLDRPFQVGDWVKVNDTEGTVESVGLRSTRIRTFYNSQITVPNSELMNARVDNMGRRRYRRTFTHLSLTYDTAPEQFEAFCEGIREIIRQHPYTRKDYYQVYVSRFSDSSIDVMLYVFHECPDWAVELRERHRLFLDIIRLARRIGVQFAFPTRTLHLFRGSDEPLPPGTPMVPAVSDDAVKFGREQAEALLKESDG